MKIIYDTIYGLIKGSSNIFRFLRLCLIPHLNIKFIIFTAVIDRLIDSINVPFSSHDTIADKEC